MSENISSPQELVQKWREGKEYEHDFDRYDSEKALLRLCADELAAILPAWEARVKLAAQLAEHDEICEMCYRGRQYEKATKKHPNLPPWKEPCERAAKLRRALAADPSKEGA